MYKFRACAQSTFFKTMLAVQKSIFSLTNGKLAKGRFLSALDIPCVGTNVKIVKQTEDATFVAKFNPDGTYDNSDFRVLCTTDLHLHTNPWANNLTLQHLIWQIADLKPDLVVFTGDTILSNFQQRDAIQFAEMMERLGVYWTYVFGNHEAREEKGPFKYTLYKSLVDSPMCLSKFGKADLFGFGNFTVNVMNDENSLRQSLVFLDSGRDIIEEYARRDGVPVEWAGSYDYVKPTQIEWYTNHVEAMNKQYGKAPSMIYLHIPIPEYEGFFEDDGQGGYTVNPDTQLLYGMMRESVGCSKYNSGLFDAMKKVGGQAIFCGHDHCNDFCVVKDGIYLVYNKTGGYSTYELYETNKLSADETTWHFGVNWADIHADSTVTLDRRSHVDFLKI